MILKPKKYNMLDCVYIVLKSSPAYACLVILFEVVSALAPSVTIFATADFVDTAMSIFAGDIDRNAIIMPLLFIMGISAYNYLSGTLMHFVVLRMGRQLHEKLQEEFTSKLSRLKYRWIENSETQDVIRRASYDPAGRIQSRFYSVISCASFAINVFSIVSILISQIWWVGVATILMSVPVFLISIKNGKRTYQAFEEANKHERRADFYDSVLVQKDFLEERALFGYTRKIKEDWRKEREGADNVTAKAILTASTRTHIVWLIAVVMSVTIIGMLLPSLKDGNISPGMFIGLSTAALNLTRAITWTLSGLAENFMWFEKYLVDLSSFSQMEEQEGANDLPADMSQFVFDSIEFRNVSFKYPNTERYILKNCSFILKGNRHYAFVGVNGAGKTTITKLLTKLYDNYEGDIFINGKNLREYPLSHIKGIFSVVYQDFAVYSLKVKDCVKLGNVLADDDEKMISALRAIDLENVVNKLPNGAETYLGKENENGLELSGGEWQRLAIARSLYGNRPISILDEPTSALDPVAESGIYEMYRKISKGKSAIFITHRLGAARIADEIIVIEDGKVAEQGSHDELLNKNGMYADMFKTQKRWYEV